MFDINGVFGFIQGDDNDGLDDSAHQGVENDVYDDIDDVDLADVDQDDLDDDILDFDDDLGDFADDDDDALAFDIDDDEDDGDDDALAFDIDDDDDDEDDEDDDDGLNRGEISFLGVGSYESKYKTAKASYERWSSIYDLRLDILRRDPTSISAKNNLESAERQMELAKRDMDYYKSKI